MALDYHEDQQMLTGTIKLFFDDRGFGFIRPDQRGETDRFFHLRSVVPLGSVPKEGQRVEYELGPDPKTGGSMAVNVRVR